MMDIPEINDNVFNDQSPNDQVGSPVDQDQPTDITNTPELPPTSKTPPKSVLRIVVGIICSAFPVIAGITAMIVAINCDFNSKYLNTPSASVLTAISIASVLIPFICSLILVRTSSNPKEIKKTNWSAFLPLVASMYLAYHALTNEIGGWENAILLLSLVAAVFFALKIFIKHDVLKILFALGMFALGTAIIGLLYLDFGIELNSPFKLAVQFGAVALILGTIADARATLSRIKPAWFIFFKSVASALGLICTGLIFTAFARNFSILPNLYFELTSLYTCYAINSIAEIISVSFLTPNNDINTNT